MRTIEERFWNKVEKTGGCWNWVAHKNRDGYGQFALSKGDAQGAHRIAWILTNGEIPAGLMIDHKCHNRACVNPAHLRLATNKQNRENLPSAYKNSKSGVRGVSWHKPTEKWIALVRHNGKLHHVGLFLDIGEAEKAVTAKRNELFTHNLKDRVA